MEQQRKTRRVGWFDCVAVKYSSIINGLTDINLTKPNVLSGVKKIKINVNIKMKKEIFTKHY